MAATVTSAPPTATPPPSTPAPSASLESSIDQLIAQPPFSSRQADKESPLLAVLQALTAHHRRQCREFDRICAVGFPRAGATLAELPWLPVGLFKSHRLVSVPAEDVATTLTSSGTTGQVPSQIFLDRATAQRQTAALAAIMKEALGPRRMPMLIIDQRDLLKNRSAFSARGAGVLGMMNFGAQPVFALDENLELDLAAVESFLQRHHRAPFLVFGFTFMVWKYFFEKVRDRGFDLSQGVLIHSGGWKKLLESQVSNQVFRAELTRGTGLVRIHNFYGMVEQVGSVFLEGSDGLLHPPRFADVIVRDPITLEPVAHGTPGVLQLVSALPTSYPGHSILTEDLGVVETEDEGPWMGKGLRILGRIPRAELRGCSDTLAAEVSRAG